MRDFMRRCAPGHSSRLILDRSLHPRDAAHRRAGRRPALEPLESRVQLSTITWTNPAGGDWNVAANWNLGRVPQASDDVTIPALGSGITVSISSADSTVHSLVSGTNITLTKTLDDSGTLQMSPGATLTLLGGSLRDATVTSGSQVVITPSNGTLKGVTMDGDLDLSQQAGSTLYVIGTLVLNGTMTIGNAAGSTYGVVVFSDTGVTRGLSGSGTIVFGGAPYGTNQSNQIENASPGTGALPLTIGPGITIHGDNGEIHDTSTSATIVNEATISADTAGGTIGFGTIYGSMVNSGTINVSAGATLQIGANLTASGIGTINNSGGKIILEGTVDLGGGTLATSVFGGPLVLFNGTIENGTIDESAAAPIYFEFGTLQAVTFNGDMDVAEGNPNNDQVTIRAGLVLNGTMYLGNASGTTWGNAVFVDNGTAVGSLTGNGTVVFGGNSLGNSLTNQSQLGGAAGTLTIGPGITLRGASGLISNVDSSGTIVIQGTLQADVKGGTINLGDYGVGTFASEGSLAALNGGTLATYRPVTFFVQNTLQESPDGTIRTSANLLSAATNPALSSARGLVVFNGYGSPSSPQLFEVMSQDLGASAAAFTQNFAFGTVELAGSTYVKLADQSRNSPGGGAEALYVNSLVVPLQTTLNLNGLHVYVRNAQVGGTIVGGTITRIPAGGPIGFNSPVTGNIVTSGQHDHWSFSGRAGTPITITLDPGSSAAGGPIAPQLAWGQVQLLDSANHVIASADGTTAGLPLALSNVSLPADGTYTIVVSAASSQSGSTGNYVLTATSTTAATTLNAVAGAGPYRGTATLTATLTAGPTPVAGEPVEFYLTQGGVTKDLGSAITAANGVAALDGVSLSGLAPTNNAGMVRASFLGDANYADASANGTLVVNQATPTITWPNPADITYGTQIGSAQLDATSSVPGTFVYSPAAGTVLKAGAQDLTVTFTPTDTTDYTTTTATVKINVQKVTPSITWSNPADIVAGTPLGAGQLDATVSVPGTFTYSPAPGTLLPSGQGQTLSVTFNPTDSTDYASATASVSLNVLPPNQKFNPVIAWSNPADIVYGTPLGATQLDATATYGGQTVAGTFTYAPAAGTILNAGQGQTLSVTFVPSDTADYNNATASVAINVTPAPLVVTVDDATKVYGQSNPAFTASYSGLQGSDTAGSLGTLSFSTSAGSSSDVGAYDVTVSGLSTENYAITYAKGTLSITPAAQTISWSEPGDIKYGTALGAAQLDASATGSGAAPAGALTYTPEAGTVLGVGNGQTLTVVAAATLDYAQATASVAINVVKSAPTITWTSPAAITYGTALGDAQLDATASVPGTFTYTPAAGTFLDAGQGQTLSVTFTPTDSTDYSTTTATTRINVTPAPLTVTANDASRVYGQDNPSFDVTYSGFVLGQGAGDLGILGGKFDLTTTATPSSDVGDYPIAISGFTLTTSNYAITYVDGTLSVTPAPLTVTANNPRMRRGSPLPALTYTIGGFVNGDTSAVVTGTPDLSTPATSLSAAGTFPITIAAGSLAAKDYTFTQFLPGVLTVQPSAASADYNGDGRSDFGFYQPSTATFVDVPAGARPIVVTHFGGPGWVATTGDYDGDGKTDVGLYNAASGTFLIQPSHGGAAIVIHHFGGPGSEPLSGDYDGDGKTDIGVYNPSTAVFAVVPSGGGKPLVLTHFGGPGWVATSADYDGDGKTDIGLYNGAAGKFMVIPSHGGAPIVITHFGGPGAEPLSGDYNGDGRTDFGYYDPATAMFVDVPAGGKPIVRTHFGGPGWVATSGDYDGDGKTDVGLYDAAAGTFLVVPSQGGSPIVIRKFGGRSAMPLSTPAASVGATDSQVAPASATTARAAMIRAQSTTTALPLDLGQQSRRMQRAGILQGKARPNQKT